MLPSGSLNQAIFILFADMDVAAHFQAGHVIMLEGHALALQRRHLGVDIVDLPGDRGRLIGAGKFGAVDIDVAVAALEDERSSSPSESTCFKPKVSRVEAAGAVEIA